MAKLRKYDDSSIQSITNDRDRIRKRPTMYIPNTKKEGAIHIIFEIIDNSVDELSVDNSVGKTITTIFDDKTKEATVIDDGSGIPHGKMLEALTVLNTSGKFDNDDYTAYQTSGGTNGVGLKLSVAESLYSTATSMRDGKSLTYKFKDGYLEDTITSKTKDHGTIIKFKIDQKLVDIKSVSAADLVERYSEKAYLFPDITFNLTILNDGKEVSTKTYTGKDIEQRVKKMKPDTDIIRITEERKVTYLKNTDDAQLTTSKVGIDVAFAFKEGVLDGNQDDFLISYGNTIKTYTGGMHIEGLKLGIVKFFKEQIIPKMSNKDKELPIMPSDMTAGLCGFIVAKVFEPEFRGQYKDQLSNQEVKFAVRDSVYEALCNEKSSTIKDMTEFVKRVTRGRMASKKTRKKDVSNAFSKDRIEKFKDIIQSTMTVSPELVLVEGDSAADNVANARDPYNQAIYGVKKPKNMFDNTTDAVNDAKTTFNDILDICGITAGKKCNPDNSRMNKILMLTDGDIDGDQIAISVVCLIAKHCRPLIDAGMVGRILPPAYSYEEGKGKDGEPKKIFVRSQREFFDHVMSRFVKKVKVSHKSKEFNKKELYDFLDKNFTYDKKLDNLADRYCCDPKLIEYIARKYHGSYKDQKKSYWMEQMKPFPELRVLLEHSTVIIDGDVPGYGYLNMALDEYFERHVKRFKEFQDQNTHITGYTLNDEKDKTVYDVMACMRKYTPPGVKRYKGLGELNSEEIGHLCMDVNTRTVIYFKFEDFDAEMAKINVIMSTKKEFAQQRANVLQHLTANDLDIDT